MSLQRDLATVLPLRTARLTLEPLSLEHAEAILAYELRNRSHLRPWEPLRDESYYALGHQQNLIVQSVAEARRGNCVRFVAFQHSGAEVLALFNLWNVRYGAKYSALLGYSVDAAHQGNGYATEAAAAVLQFAFDVLQLHRVEANYQPQNDRSARVLEKVGFEVEGYARDYLLIAGQWEDAILVSRINPSWQAP